MLRLRWLFGRLRLIDLEMVWLVGLIDELLKIV